MKLFLGIDTSNYTTSLCLLTEKGQILSDLRRMLIVPAGARGLRQSEALFQHVKNLPQLTAELAPHLAGTGCIEGIGVSVRPRTPADSYLPVFLPGFGLAQSLAHVLGVPCYTLTHQENHIWSGLGGAGGPRTENFLSIHLSGGTTELVSVRRERQTQGLTIDLWGSTTDLHAGQFVDRLGVGLGLEFPAGPELERLAGETEETVPVATFHKEGQISFSGPLTALERLIGKVPPPVLALTALKAISRTLLKWVRWLEEQTDCRQLLIVGGVAANALIRRELQADLKGWSLYFAPPALSSDNAYGAAYYAAAASGNLAFDTD